MIFRNYGAIEPKPNFLLFNLLAAPPTARPLSNSTAVVGSGTPFGGGCGGVPVISNEVEKYKLLPLAGSNCPR